jgi:tetratricopeptide (TPR) repeat protein
VGETVKQLLPDADGNLVEWTFTRSDERPADFVPPPLPEPAPREAPPDELTDSARALHARGLEAWKQGEIREALALLEAAVETDPDDRVSRSDYGRLLMLSTQYGAAYAHLERAAELAPDEPRVWLDLLSYYERKLMLKHAWEARRKAEETAAGRPLVQHEFTGLWILEGDSIYP